MPREQIVVIDESADARARATAQGLAAVAGSATSTATSVVTSSGAAGRLLGHAVHEPRVTEILEDLLSVGEGLDIAHRPVEEPERAS